MTIFGSAAETREGLRRVGYLTTMEVASAVFQSASQNKPILLEGPAGAGKTELALSVARAEGLRVIRLQCYEGITHRQAVGEYMPSMQNLYVEFNKGRSGVSWEPARDELNSREFFNSGPLLQALESKERCVLLIDELDKVDKGFEAMLLEILSVWEMSVTGLGTTRTDNPPFTVVTSNAERILGDAIRRRCIFLEIGYPKPELEAEIVARKTPQLSPVLHLFIAGFAQALRAYNMLKPPSISEMVDLARGIDLMGKSSVDPQDVELFLPLIAKTTKDRQMLLEDRAFQTLILSAIRNLIVILAGMSVEALRPLLDDPAMAVLLSNPAVPKLFNRTDLRAKVRASQIAHFPSDHPCYLLLMGESHV